MSFQTTKKEAAELYTFFRLLEKGTVAAGTANAQPDDNQSWPIAMIEREEHDGTCRYHIKKDSIEMIHGTKSRDGVFSPYESSEKKACVSRSGFATAADLLLQRLKEPSGEQIEVPDELESFLNSLCIYNLEAQTNDRTDLKIAFWEAEAPLHGFVIRCRLSPMNPLLDGGRTANLKLEQSGARFSSPTVNKINALTAPTNNEVAERIRMIERLGGILKYSDVADRVFRCNLLMIDLHFPRMLTEMVRLMHMEGISRTTDLIERIKTVNPLKIKDELIQKHRFYEYKTREFLLALALGMRPAKIFNGQESAVEGMIFTDANGVPMCYHQSRRQIFADFLYHNTRFEKGAPNKDKYGLLERENGIYYFKLNAKISLLKR